MANKEYYGAMPSGYTNAPSSIGVPPQAYGAPPPNGNRPEMQYAPQQNFYQNSASAPYYNAQQPYYAPQQQPLYATQPGVSGRPAGGRGGGERGFFGAVGDDTLFDVAW